MYGNLLSVLAATGLMISIATSARVQAQGPQTPPVTLGSIAGRDSFELYCASCHGKTGKGDGPTAPALKTQPTDLTSLARRSGGVFPKDHVLAVVTGSGRHVAAHGSSDMPVWGPIFRALDPSDARVRQRIENIVAYIEALQEPSAVPRDTYRRERQPEIASRLSADGRSGRSSPRATANHVTSQACGESPARRASLESHRP